MDLHLYHVTIRKTEDTTIALSASSPERALQKATNIAAGERLPHDVVSIKTDNTPLPNSVKKVSR